MCGSIDQLTPSDFQQTHLWSEDPRCHIIMSWYLFKPDHAIWAVPGQPSPASSHPSPADSTQRSMLGRVGIAISVNCSSLLILAEYNKIMMEPTKYHQKPSYTTHKNKISNIVWTKFESSKSISSTIESKIRKLDQVKSRTLYWMNLMDYQENFCGYNEWNK